jgi:hypothetical protein
MDKTLHPERLTGHSEIHEQASGMRNGENLYLLVKQTRQIDKSLYLSII